MAKRREKTPSKQMRKIVLVICEGVTEANYISLLRKWYKSPIKIISYVEGNKISQRIIDKRVKDLKISVNDKLDVFLMYDMDVPSTNEKLLACNAGHLLSNPCVELWLLLHGKNQKMALSTQSALYELKKSSSIWANYNKSAFTQTQEIFLREQIHIATERSKSLIELSNPSSGIFKLIDYLEENK